MHSKYFWGVHKREAIDAVQVLLYGLEDRDAIALVVAEGWLEHPLIEPVLHGECRISNRLHSISGTIIVSYSLSHKIMGAALKPPNDLWAV